MYFIAIAQVLALVVRGPGVRHLGHRHRLPDHDPQSPRQTRRAVARQQHRDLWHRGCSGKHEQEVPGRTRTVDDDENERAAYFWLILLVEIPLLLCFV